MKDEKSYATKNFASIAPERKIKLINGKVEIHAEHANANIKILSSAQTQKMHQLHIQWL